MKQFDGVDFLEIDGLFSEEEIAVRDTIRSFVQDRIMPIIEKHNREGTFPAHLIPEMAELGVFGANIQGYGCPGLNNVAYGLIMQELERGDSGIRSFVSVQGGLCMYPILAYGSDEQKNKWLPEMGKGKVIGCFGLTEADYGSNPSGMITTAKKDKDGYVLNGSKMWITNGGIAHIAIVWAKLDGKIRGFIVEQGTPGYSTRDIHGKFSLRASVTSELSFQDCHIPAGNILPNVEGLKGPLGCLNQARYGIAWGGLGAAMACFHEAVEYSKTRIQFDRPIAGFQMVQEKLAWMIREITKGQLLALQLGRLKDAGKVKPHQVSLGKMNNVDVALRCARLAREILGASGITDEYQCGRHMCNLESVYTYEGTHDIHTLVLGEAVTGIAAYK
ncbi:MAG TPA: acyl-CoA dehydrogenase family protein [Candidatus Eisenbacteria bacterium]|jgi:glutaryl-CoA dehydrogenase|nr:acyl-CoA dehydrogenase family protein [Candidatus Eisenbacteria bacterium]